MRVDRPSFVVARDVHVRTSRGTLTATIAYGGANYAIVDATTVGLRVDAGGPVLHHASIVGSVFTGTIVARAGAAVIAQVTGMAYRTGEHTFTVDPDDPLTPGFVPR